MRDNFDDNLREFLVKGTENSVKQKEEVWKKIENRLELNERLVMDMKRSRGPRVKKAFGAAIAAVVITSTLFTVTQPGQAAVEKIREFFAVQKKIVEIEGNPEEKDVNLHESKMGYVIYVDEELYTMEKGENVDRISPKHKAENLPEVFMEIRQISEKDPQSVATELEKDLKKDFPSVENKGEVEKPIKGTLITAKTGNSSSDTVVNYYVIDNTKEGTFLVKQQYFLEAAEGHGARFYYMLEDFKIVELENK